MSKTSIEQQLHVHQQILEHIFDNPSAVENIIECSPECCELCGQNTKCDGRAEFCKQYHLEDVNRILQNIKKQDK